MFYRVPSEGDIRDLSPSLTDALLMARSFHKLCARHRSELAVPFGQGAGGRGVGSEDEAAADSQLWVNDQISDVRREREMRRLCGRGWGSKI